MKITLPKDRNILSCMDAVTEFLMKEKGGVFADVVAGSMYLTLKDKDGNVTEDRGEYTIDDEGFVVPVKKEQAAAGTGDREAIKRAVTERVASDLVKAERQQERDRKAEKHAYNMKQSSMRYNRREETQKSWVLESDEAKKALTRSNALVRDLRAILKALGDKNERTDLYMHYSTFDKGIYAGKAGAVALLDLGGDKGLLYSYRGLQRVSMKKFNVEDYRGNLILGIQ